MFRLALGLLIAAQVAVLYRVTSTLVGMLPSYSW